MGWSGGVLKGSCAAFGEEGRGLEEEPRNPIASSWILTPITDPGTEKDAKGGGGCGGGIDFGGCFSSGHTLCPTMCSSNHRILLHTVKSTVSN